MVPFFNSNLGRLERRKHQAGGLCDHPGIPGAKQRLQNAAGQWEEYPENLPEADRSRIEDYLDCLEDLASRREQRAYAQGYVDCVQVLGKLGLLKGNPDVVIANMKS